MPRLPPGYIDLCIHIRRSAAVDVIPGQVRLGIVVPIQCDAAVGANGKQASRRGGRDAIEGKIERRPGHKGGPIGQRAGECADGAVDGRAAALPHDPSAQ